VDNQAQSLVEGLIGQYGWLFLAGVLTLIFQNTIREAVDGLMVFLGNDYNEDDVVEVDGEPGRIVRVSMWKTVFFIYHVVDGKVMGGSKLVVANSKLKDLKIEKPLPNLDLSKYSKND
tara:strand:+ start:23323 stop:23676 length:354 start_codon:yes stop_codon:yes gene_type:complete